MEVGTACSAGERRLQEECSVSECIRGQGSESGMHCSSSSSSAHHLTSLSLLSLFAMRQVLVKSKKKAEKVRVQQILFHSLSLPLSSIHICQQVHE